MRGIGGAVASGSTLIFVDADVEMSQDSIPKLIAVFATRPDVAAIFGAYDETPSEQNFVSQYKNLAHSYIHQSSLPDAKSFWAGLGAVRADVFHAIGGFDERFKRPSIEDIELGYRLSEKGCRILLDPSIRGRHLKRWGLLSLIKTDVRDRAIPWTQLILRSSILQNDLNVRWADRASVALCHAVLMFISLSLAGSLLFLLAAAGSLALFLLLNWGFYAFLARKRGLAFGLRAIPLHFLHYVYSGFSFVVGSTLFLLGRATGSDLPGAIPRRAWVAKSASANVSASGR